MAEKSLNTRIQQKHDTQVNWEKATGFIPKAGEVIVYDADENYSYPRIKIGDGDAVVSALPFANEKENIIINFSSENGTLYTADLTFTEVSNAFADNKIIFAKVMGSVILPLIQCTEESILFSALLNDSGTNGLICLDYLSNNTVVVNIQPLVTVDETLTESGSAADAAITGAALSALETDYNETIIGLEVNGKVVTYIKGDGSRHSFETQDTDTTYSLATDKVTGLTKLYATTGSAEDGTMTQKAIKTELDKKVGVTVNDSTNTLVFTI